MNLQVGADVNLTTSVNEYNSLCAFYCVLIVMVKLPD